VTKFKPFLLCGPAAKGPSFCGDGALDPARGEQCDGADLGGETCASRGFRAGGTLACSPSCEPDTSGCQCAALPASGQVTSFTADKNDGIGDPVSVPDDGTVQAGQPLAYGDNGDGTITDRNTGLMWEKKSNDDGLHDQDTAYFWSGNGTQETIWDWLDDLNNTCANDDTVECTAGGETDCENAGIGGACGFAGYRDWRIPNIRELQTIVNYGASGPLVDAVFSTECPEGCTVLDCSCTRGSTYWQSTTSPTGPVNAFVVSFGDGVVATPTKETSAFVRAVRYAF
jgi:hypothetical protein